MEQYENYENILLLVTDNKIEKVADFIEAKGDLNLQDGEGNNVLMLAAMYGHTQIAKLLIKAKINIDLQNKKGETALMMAALFNHPRIVSLLLKAGANREIKDKRGSKAALIIN